MPGKLILCATPIGNLGDAPPRLRGALEEADVVYAEDTRRSRALLEALGVSRRPRSYFAGNEAARAEELGGHLAEGRTVALLTDAGVPGISDPGLSAVVAARAAGAEVTVVPGPSAVTAALAVSGLPSDRFAFEGFLPRSGRDRSERLAELGAEPRTIVIFCAPARLVADLRDLRSAMGAERRLTVARELTKAFEEVWHGTLAEAIERWGSEAPRGELTVVVEGAPPPPLPFDEAVEQAERLIGSGTPLSEAVKATAEELGVPRRRLYEAVLRRRG